MSNERPLQPGDLVEIIGSERTSEKNRHFIGCVGTIAEIRPWHGGYDGTDFGRMYAVLRESYLNVNGWGWFVSGLRRIPPKSDPVSNYTDQFTPASPEWVEDLKRSLGVVA